MRPSGDHAGSKSCAGLVVRRRSLVPLALIVQMSSVLLEKVILPGRAGTSIGALAREAGGAGWLLAGGARPDPRPGCVAPRVVQAASSTPSPAVRHVASRSDLTGRPSQETFTCHTPKAANGFPQRAGRSGGDEGGQDRMRRRGGADPPCRGISVDGPVMGCTAVRNGAWRLFPPTTCRSPRPS